MATDAGRAGDERVPRLASGCDPTKLELSPAEGYLLSRVDGSTRWGLLRQMGGLPERDVDRCLERWLRQGVLVVEGDDEAEEGDPPPAPALPEAKLDASLAVPIEVQREVLALGKRLRAPHHEILGVAPDASTGAIKKAYFKLSKKFHPDRYFRKNVGAFGAHLEALFKRVLEAYELLSDPMTRAELQKSLAASGAEPKAEVPATSSRSPRRIAESMSLLAAHKRARVERRRRAKQLFEAGMSAFRGGRWLEAARGVRLAMAFDPHNDAIRDSFSDVQRRAHEEQAKVLVKRGDEAFDLRDFEDSLRHYEEALHYRPFDASLCAKVGKIAWQVSGDLRKAKEYAAEACELEPDDPGYRLLLGRVYKAAGLKANARRELEVAARLDPTRREARSEMRGL